MFRWRRSEGLNTSLWSNTVNISFDILCYKVSKAVGKVLSVLFNMDVHLSIGNARPGSVHYIGNKVCIVERSSGDTAIIWLIKDGMLIRDACLVTSLEPVRDRSVIRTVRDVNIQ